MSYLYPVSARLSLRAQRRHAGSRVCLTLAVAAVAFVPVHASAQVTSWAAPASGNWSSAAAWTAGIPNSATADATVAATGSAYTVTLNDTRSVRSLLLDSAVATVAHAGGTLTVASSLSAPAGSYAFSSGTLRGNGTATFTGSLGLSTISTKFLLDALRVVLQSTSSWTGGGILLDPAVRVVIDPGGLLLASPGASVVANSSPGARIANNGTFRNTAGTTTLSVPLDNTGAVDVAAGTLALGAGGTSSGSFSVSAPALLSFSTSYTHNPGSSLSGPGTFTFAGGTHTLSTGMFSPTGRVNFSGGSVSVADPLTLLAFGPVAGTAVLAQPLTVTAPLTVSSNGSLTLQAQPTFGGPLSLEGGTINLASGLTATFPNASTSTSGTLRGNGTYTFTGGITLSGGGNKFLLDTTRVVLQSTSSWTGGGILLDPGARVVVAPDALLLTSPNASASANVNAPGAQFLNNGTLRQTAGFTSIFANVIASTNTHSFTNNGTVEAVAGTFAVHGTYVTNLSLALPSLNDYLGLTGGTWIVRPGARIDVVSTNSTVGVLAATVVLDGASANLSRFAGAVPVPLLNLSTIAATGSITYINRVETHPSLARHDGSITAGAGASVSLGSAVTGVGSVTVAPTGTVSLTGQVSLHTASLQGRLSVTPSTTATFTGGVIGTGSATVAATGWLVTPRLQLAGLTTAGRVTASPFGGFTQTLNALSITGTGFLDLTNNDLVVRSGDIAALTAAVAAWWNEGTRQGPGLGTTHFNTAFPGAHWTTLAVVSNTTPFGFPVTSVFSGVPVAPADVLVKYTYFGDTDLNGLVDARDLQTVLRNWSNATPNPGWAGGDINYDGIVDGTDYQLTLAAFASQGTPLGDLTSPPGGTLVPEPTALALLTLPALALQRRRR